MPQAAVGPIVLVVLPPAGENLSGVVQVDEPVLRQALTPEADVERLDVGAVRRLAWPAKVQSDTVPMGPVVERLRGELGPTVHGDERGQVAPALPSLAQDVANAFWAKGGPEPPRVSRRRGYLSDTGSGSVALRRQ